MKFRIRNLFALIAAVTAVFLLSVTAFAACEEHRPDGGVLTLEPTCELIGVITYTCQNEGCSYSFTEKIGNLGGHRYVNGVCANCGGYEEGYIPEEPLPEETSVTLSKVPMTEAPVQEPDPAPITIAPKADLSASPAGMASAVSPQTSGFSLFHLLALILTVVCGISAILLGRRLARR